MKFSESQKKTKYPFTVFSPEIDEYLIENYGFKHEKDVWGYGKGLQKVFPQDDGFYYMWINITRDIIYLYQEYNCGGKTWDVTIDLEEEDPITSAKEILDILDRWL